ncbi:MAG: hypothetical protein WCL53_09880 [Chloroflexota bacterium]
MPVAWRAGEGPKELRPDRYPAYGAEFGLQVGTTSLAAQDAQNGAIDTKLGIVSAIAITIVAGIAGTVVTDQIRVPRWELNLLLFLYVTSLIHAFRGLLLKTFAAPPALTDVRKTLDGSTTESDDGLWSVVTSFENAIAENDCRLREKAASYKIALSLLMAASYLTAVLAFWS